MSASNVLLLSAEQIVAALEKTELFSELGNAALRSIAECSRAYRFRKDALVFERDEDARALYVVESGAISIVSAENAHDQTLASYSTGDAFGEMELLNEQKRSATARAEADSVLIRFPRKGYGFASFVKDRPEAAALLFRASLRVVASRIRNANALVKENSPWVQELRRQAYADKLTGLNNKAFLEEWVARRCAGAGDRVALLMFKPDNFKEINDRYGHEAGDETLKIAAEALRKAYGESAPTIRYQGNEMAVLLDGANWTVALAEAKRIIAILGALDLSAVTGGPETKLSVSVGAVLYPDHAATGADLIAAAHELPLIGRARGGNRVLFPEDR